MTLPRNINDITTADVEALVNNAVPEDSHLDYKRDLPGRDDAARGALVGDASAFANATGGDLIYGVDEDGEGRAARIAPITANPDDEARRVLDVLLNGVEPRMPGVQVRPVPVPGGFILVVRVPQSWTGPHRAKTNQHFYVREGLRSRKLDVPEVRGLFLRSEAQAQRIRDFRTGRLGLLLSGESPVRLQAGALLVVHLIPTEAALGNLSVDPVLYSERRHLPALGTTVPGARLNLDGALGVRNVDREGCTHGYSQMFRNGYFETLKVLTAFDGTAPILPSLSYEQELIQLVERFRQELAFLGTSTEMTCMLSLLRANSVLLGLDRGRFMFLDPHQGHFDRDTLPLPDVLVAADVAAVTALRPVFDLVWQSAGLQRSFNYDEHGNWAAR